mmetsp:Transcript_8130/g.15082  ORF Transcript_8130/g.15082 Transcript_8130/m.15082 type:complete len:104 (+) Transcript_8130:144-455(+)
MERSFKGQRRGKGKGAAHARKAVHEKLKFEAQNGMMWERKARKMQQLRTPSKQRILKESSFTQLFFATTNDVFSEWRSTLRNVQPQGRHRNRQRHIRVSESQS